MAAIKLPSDKANCLTNLLRLAVSSSVTAARDVPVFIPVPAFASFLVEKSTPTTAVSTNTTANVPLIMPFWIPSFPVFFMKNLPHMFCDCSKYNTNLYL